MTNRLKPKKFFFKFLKFKIKHCIFIFQFNSAPIIPIQDRNIVAIYENSNGLLEVRPQFNFAIGNRNENEICQKNIFSNFILADFWEQL